VNVVKWLNELKSEPMRDVTVAMLVKAKDPDKLKAIYDRHGETALIAALIEGEKAYDIILERGKDYVGDYYWGDDGVIRKHSIRWCYFVPGYDVYKAVKMKCKGYDLTNGEIGWAAPIGAEGRRAQRYRRRSLTITLRYHLSSRRRRVPRVRHPQVSEYLLTFGP